MTATQATVVTVNGKPQQAARGKELQTILASAKKELDGTGYARLVHGMLTTSTSGPGEAPGDLIDGDTRPMCLPATTTTSLRERVVAWFFRPYVTSAR
jgi:hypothetical protein